MAEINLGRVGFVNKGAFSDGLHKVNDIVTYGGSPYACIAEHTSVSGNILPTNTGYWIKWLDDNVYTESEVDNLLDDKVSLTGDETIAGIKTFASSPIVPTPTTDTQVANKEYVDARTFNIPSTYQGAYGLTWNNTNDTYVRTGAAGYTSIQSLMKRCTLNTDGTVNYYLSPYNSNYKEDGSASTLDGTDGNVMVQIPRFYVKYDNTSGAKNVSIALTAETGYTVHNAFVVDGVEVDYRYYRAYEGYNQGGVLKSRSGVTPTRSATISTFRGWAEANGTGWHQTDWNLLHAVQILMLIEIGTFRSQEILGNGNDTGSDYGMTTGGSNGIGNGSSLSTNDNTWMSYRGIENFYGDIWEFIDGINISDRTPYISDDPSDFETDVFTGDYVSSGITMPSASGSYIRDINFSDKGFIPTNVSGGSSSTYVPDGLWTNSGNRIVIFGGNADLGALVGAFCLNGSDSASLSYSTVGGSVAR